MVDACRYFAGLIVGALTGTTKDELLSPRYCPVPGLWEREPLAPRLEQVAEGSFREKVQPTIRGTGYVVQALEAALWAFERSSSFREGALLAVNLGDDTDITGAIFGRIGEACYGVRESPRPGASGLPGGASLATTLACCSRWVTAYGRRRQRNSVSAIDPLQKVAARPSTSAVRRNRTLHRAYSAPENTSVSTGA